LEKLKDLTREFHLYQLKEKKKEKEGGTMKLSGGEVLLDITTKERVWLP